MANLVELVPISTGDLRKRRERLTDFLDAWGDLEVRDAGDHGALRLLEFVLTSPGDGLAPEVHTVFREYYRRAQQREMWEIAKYTYEYHDLSRDLRLAYHLHDLRGRPLVPHAHCGKREPQRDDADQRGHLRATEYELREAHQEFMRYYAGGTSPNCARFLPLDVSRL